MSKMCTKCGVVKPLDGFHRNKGGVDGRRSHCKECVREYKRRYHEENRDKRLEYARRYHEGNRDKRREYRRRHYEENRDKELEYQLRYREENRDKMLDYKRRYYEENRDILNQGHKMSYAQKTRTSNLLASKKGAPYSPGEDALILADNGMTGYQKAIELGRTHGSVKARKRRLRARANQRETPFGELETTTHERGIDATTA